MSRELRTVKMKKSSGGIKKSFTNKKFKSGAYSSFITILVIAIVVVVNLVFGKLDLSSDLSSNSLFTLSKDTKKALKSAKNSVTLYYLVTDGKETEYIEKVLDQYPKASSKVKLKKIDPVVNPGFASKYLSESEAGSVAQNDVIVVNDSTKNSSYVQSTDMYYSNTDYSSYTQSSGEYYLDVEGKITSAIQKVLAEKKTKMYVLKGHDELEVGTTMSTSFSKMNIDTDELTLYSEDKVPSDCDILLINGATKDISKEEKNKILSKKVASAKELEKEILEKAEIEAKSKKERVISGAKLKARNEKLAAKQEVIEEVFSKSVETLCKLNDREFVKFIKDSILSLNIDGDETLILNEDGNKIVSKEVVAEINAELKAKGLKGEIKISETIGSFRGGFILEKGGVEINNTFESLVDSLKDQLEFEVAKVLFN